ncbi:2Fe-2S iron-sulfur cluster-binding protein [Devosia sp.]|uniref:2Fe-2S iron-sulfur cluster-binding protein n=1 Tax=Devosia sp. TaxID=1871048 RepID=UPI003BA9A199
MPKLHSITANGTTFSARSGEFLLDSALAQGIAFPHDCRAGRCGSCLTKVARGSTLGGASMQRGMVHACQARVFSDLDISFEQLPPVRAANGEVTSLKVRCADVIEVGIKLANPIVFRPGQYCTFKFRGFPARSFSPTLPADGSSTTDDITLHIKRVRDGRVSMALGEDILQGHKVRVEGPFGAAFFRPGRSGRMVLVAGGTGFAPILSIASAALHEDHAREMVVVTGARTVPSLYMARGLVTLQSFPGVKVIVTASEVPQGLSIVRTGSPDQHTPDLKAEDVVYAAGAPAMIKLLAARADRVGAEFYSDPFEASGNARDVGTTQRLAWPNPGPRARASAA